MSLEDGFDTEFIAALASREKQIQQTYRPVIGIHKWFARRPGTLFRGLLLSEFSDAPLPEAFTQGHRFEDKVIADPFMGGGTPLIEANRLGMRVIGADINPMAYWIVRQALATVDLSSLRTQAELVANEAQAEIGDLYETTCNECGSAATVKYFLWVKQYQCRACKATNDVFPGYLIATNDRHTSFVWYCPSCEQLAEIESPPTDSAPVACPHCDVPLPVHSGVKGGRFTCKECKAVNAYPSGDGPPKHRLVAMEYHCAACRDQHKGRYFKVPDGDDLARTEVAQQRLRLAGMDLVPPEEIPDGDETRRLHRWGYHRYYDLFNDRQLLGLQVLLRHVKQVEEREVRFALATVFSDMLRYQNMLGRYDTYALKCQDIFSVHGFPVGLMQCENNLLGIPGVGSGGFRHFVEKYLRAKDYCDRPFETMVTRGRKKTVHTEGERIGAMFVPVSDSIPPSGAALVAGDSTALKIPPESLDGVFTDPPYYDNVQYAELMDFCYVWLRQVLADEIPQFQATSTRNLAELTGNETLARGLDQFTEGLSQVFRRMAVGLKVGAPLVFTYHHNDVDAYVPLITAILDSGLTCTATLSSPAEMSASMHIHGTGSSTVDTVFVCRKGEVERSDSREFPEPVLEDARAIERSGVRVTTGDVVSMTLGHLSRMVIQGLTPTWDSGVPLEERINEVWLTLQRLVLAYDPKQVAQRFAEEKRQRVVASQ